MRGREKPKAKPYKNLQKPNIVGEFTKTKLKVTEN